MYNRTDNLQGFEWWDLKEFLGLVHVLSPNWHQYKSHCWCSEKDSESNSAHNWLPQSQRLISYKHQIHQRAPPDRYGTCFIVSVKLMIPTLSSGQRVGLTTANKVKLDMLRKNFWRFFPRKFLMWGRIRLLYKWACLPVTVIWQTVW